jgi:hypothetical protein
LALLDDLQDPDLLTVKVGGTCMVCKFISGLSAAEADAFKDLMNDRTIAKTAIARILLKNGHRIPASALNRHARQECLGDLSR